MKKILILLIPFILNAAINDTTIESAILKRIYMGNYNYNTILASAPILTMRWASDLNRPVFKNRTGTAYKMLADASTSSNTPSTRIFYADANGAAGSSANLVFDGSKLSITGKLTLSDSINSWHIKSSGRITGTDLQVSDSVKAVSGTFSGTIETKDINVTDLTSGYIPYKSTNLENSPIFTNGTNAAIGKSSVETWGISQRALQVGGNTAIMGNATESGNNFTWLLNNAYYDGSWKPYSNGSFSSFRMGATGILFAHDTGLVADVEFTPTARFGWTLTGGLTSTNGISTTTGTFSGTLTGATLNTGNGANELYPMDQAVLTTSAPTFSTVNTGQGANELYAMDQNVRSTDSINGLVFNSTRIRSGDGYYSGGVNATDFRASDSVKAVSASFTGRITGTDLQVSDSVRANKVVVLDSIIGASCKFVDRVTATDFQASDSVVCNTGYVTNNLIVNGDIIAVTGDYSGRVTGSDFEAFDSIKGTHGYFTWGISTNGDVTADADIYARSGIYTNWLTAQGLQVTDSIIGGIINTDSLQLGSGSYLKTYLDTTFYDSLFENDVYTGQLITSRIIQIGKTVTKYQRSLIATTSGGYLTIKGLPSKFRPSSSVGNAIRIVNNGTTILGMYSVTTTGLMYIRKIDNTDVDAGNLSGVTASVITWVID